MNYLVSLIKEIIAKRKLILDLSKADFKKTVCRFLFWDRMDVFAAYGNGTGILFCIPDGL